MFYQMITNARDRWFSSSACTAREVVKYIEQTDQMRDAQVDAIKTYLFLKDRLRSAHRSHSCSARGRLILWIWSRRRSPAIPVTF